MTEEKGEETKNEREPLVDVFEEAEEAVRHLPAHQRVIETVMRGCPVLPVRFGTVLPDESRAGDGDG